MSFAETCLLSSPPPDPVAFSLIDSSTMPNVAREDTPSPGPPTELNAFGFPSTPSLLSPWPLQVSDSNPLDAAAAESLMQWYPYGLPFASNPNFPSFPMPLSCGSPQLFQTGASSSLASLGVAPEKDLEQPFRDLDSKSPPSSDSAPSTSRHVSRSPSAQPELSLRRRSSSFGTSPSPSTGPKESNVHTRSDDEDVGFCSNSPARPIFKAPQVDPDQSERPESGLRVIVSHRLLVVYWDLRTNRPLVPAPKDAQPASHKNAKVVRFEPGEHYEVEQIIEDPGTTSIHPPAPWTGKGPGNAWLKGQLTARGRCDCGFSFLGGETAEDYYKRPAVIREHIRVCKEWPTQHPLKQLCCLGRAADRTKSAKKSASAKPRKPRTRR